MNVAAADASCVHTVLVPTANENVFLLWRDDCRANKPIVPELTVEALYVCTGTVRYRTYNKWLVPTYLLTSSYGTVPAGY
jgi:hypothetical protein